MKPFYYKHILFSEKTSELNYSRYVDKINEISNYITWCPAYERLKATGRPFSIVADVELGDKMSFVAEITDKTEFYGVYDYSNNCYIDVTVEKFGHMHIDDINTLQRLFSRYLSAIERGEVSPTVSLLNPEKQLLWDDRKFEIDFRAAESRIESFEKTIDADFIISYQKHITSPEQLHKAIYHDKSDDLNLGF